MQNQVWRSKRVPRYKLKLDEILGDVVLEWNGVSLEDKTFEEVQSIVGSSDGEIEVLLRR